MGGYLGISGGRVLRIALRLSLPNTANDSSYIRLTR